MYPQDQIVTITVEAVARTLNNIIYTTTEPEDTDLLYLRLVDAMLQDTRMLPTIDYRRFVLEKIVADLLIGYFHNLSVLFRLPQPAANESYSDALVSIARYGETGNPNLIGWCWLYYRYIRSELAISPDRFSRLCHITTRTLRRYQGLALARLTRLLVEAEWQVNQPDAVSKG